MRLCQALAKCTIYKWAWIKSLVGVKPDFFWGSERKLLTTLLLFSFFKILTPLKTFFLLAGLKNKNLCIPTQIIQVHCYRYSLFWDRVKLVHTQSWPISDYTNNQRSCYSTASTGHTWLSAHNTQFKFTVHWVLSHMFPVEKKLSNMSPFIAFATISNRLQVLYVLSILDHKSRLRIVKFNQ